MEKKPVRDFQVANKRVIVRVDYNVPLGKERILDDTRIQASLETVEYLLKEKAAVILISHLGRPLRSGHKISLREMAWRLTRLAKKPVPFIADCIGKKVKKGLAKLDPGEAILLENLRFYKEETEQNLFFSKELASYADLYINDAFGTAHRAHASITGIPIFLPAGAGFLMEKEIEALSSLLDNPAHPFALLVGGAKVKEKIKLLKKLMQKVDFILIGGGMANTFLYSQGIDIGDSLVEKDKADTAQELLKLARENHTKVLLPNDVIIGNRVDKEAQTKTVSLDTSNGCQMQIEKGWKILDIGPKTRKRFIEIIEKTQTVLWNGALGYTENPLFAKGSTEIAKALAKSQAKVIIGGGDTAGFLQKAKLTDKMTHVSTGGGASLKLLEGETLPGIAALDDK